jgi:hypothetical protein
MMKIQLSGEADLRGGMGGRAKAELWYEVEELGLRLTFQLPE